MNKKGDITITILVIGVFVVCSLAMLTFFIVSLKTTSDFVDVGLMEKVSLRMERGDPLQGPDAFGKPFLEEKRFVKEHFYSREKTKEVFYVKYKSLNK